MKNGKYKNRSNFINEKVDNDNNEFEEEKVMEIIEEINEEIIEDIDKLAPMFNTMLGI